MRDISISMAGYGRFKITTVIRRKERSCITTNTQAIDRYRDTDVPDRAKQHGFTRRQAANALYREIARATLTYLITMSV